MKMSKKCRNDLGESIKAKQQGSRQGSMENSQQETMHKVCNKRVRNNSAFNQPKTSTRQVAMNSAGKRTNEVARK